jgi:hypothetical protein
VEERGRREAIVVSATELGSKRLEKETGAKEGRGGGTRERRGGCRKVRCAGDGVAALRRKGTVYLKVMGIYLNNLNLFTLCKSIALNDSSRVLPQSLPLNTLASKMCDMLRCMVQACRREVQYILGFSFGVVTCRTIREFQGIFSDASLKTQNGTQRDPGALAGPASDDHLVVAFYLIAWLYAVDRRRLVDRRRHGLPGTLLRCWWPQLVCASVDHTHY